MAKIIIDYFVTIEFQLDECFSKRVAHSAIIIIYTDTTMIFSISLYYDICLNEGKIESKFFLHTFRVFKKQQEESCPL